MQAGRTFWVRGRECQGGPMKTRMQPVMKPSVRRRLDWELPGMMGQKAFWPSAASASGAAAWHVGPAQTPLPCTSLACTPRVSHSPCICSHGSHLKIRLIMPLYLLS